MVEIRGHDQWWPAPGILFWEATAQAVWGRKSLVKSRGRSPGRGSGRLRCPEA